jgi:hypothetical protein
MRASDVLVAAGDGDKGVIVVEAKKNCEIIQAWSNLETNAGDMESPMQSLVLTTKGKKSGVLVLVVSDRVKKVDAFKHLTYRFILRIGAYDGSGIPFIDLNNQFIPWPGHIGQIEEYNATTVREVAGRKTFALEVRIGNEIFSTNPEIPHKRYIEDGDILCRYMTKEMEADHVQQMASVSEEKQSAIVLLTQNQNKLNDENEVLKLRVYAYEVDFEQAEIYINALERQLLIGGTTILPEYCAPIGKGLEGWREAKDKSSSDLQEAEKILGKIKMPKNLQEAEVLLCELEEADPTMSPPDDLKRKMLLVKKMIEALE